MSDFLIPYSSESSETVEESISRQFQQWERRGRGWDVRPFPVDLEPPFRACYFHEVLIEKNYFTDDARMPGLFEKWFGGKTSIKAPTELDRAEYEAKIAEMDEPYISDCYEKEFFELQLILPKDFKVTVPVIRQLLTSLGYCAHPLSFEIIGTGDEIVVQFAATEDDRSQLKQQLAAYLSGATIQESSGYILESAWEQSDGVPLIADFGLSKEFMIPLNSVSSFDTDLLVGVAGALSNLDCDDVGIFQILFKKSKGDWTEEIMDSIRLADGKPIFAGAPELIPLAKQKISQPLYSVVVRVAAKSSDESATWQIVRDLGSALLQLSNPLGNELIPLSNEGYDEQYHESALLRRMSFRTGMLLNLDELVSLVHPPSQNVRSEKLIRESDRTKAVPEIAVGNRLILGENFHQNVTREVSLSNDQRSRHLHVIGASGSGKSTLLLGLIKQDLENGEGCCVIDPHGDLIDDVLAQVPESRINDVVLFDPSDAEFPIGFNILQANTELEKTLLASDLIATFRRMSTSWGDVMDSVLANAILAFVESSNGGTLFDLKRFLIEKGFREEFLETVRDPAIRYFWEHEFPLLAGKAPSSILIRLDAFLRQKLIRNIVCQKETKLNFREIMDSRKILLVKLSQGAIGEENAYLLGTLLISKLYQTALSRQDSKDRPFFSCYLDEFHHFITPSMENILSGVRKYNLGLVLCHQSYKQIQSRNAELAESVLSNCYTRICFALGDTDAEKFASGFSFFDATSLRNLNVGEAIGRIGRNANDFNLRIYPPTNLDLNFTLDLKQKILNHSRNNFAKSRIDVENESTVTEQLKNESQKNKVEQSPPVAKEETTIKSENNSEIETSSETSQLNLGRGGTHHQELQAVIKRMGEIYGFRVELEKPTADGNGRIDVSLNKDEIKIGCEVSVTSTANYETKNIQKCLAEGYDHVVVAVANRKKLPILKRKIRGDIPLHQQAKVKVFGLIDLLSFLRDISVPQKTEIEKEKPTGQRLDFTEACEFFNIGTSTLYRWIREGRVPFYRIGREYRFDRDELILMGRQDLTGKTKASVKLDPINIEKTSPKQKKEQNSRFRKMLNLD
jgi:excisionase family DNA binding protein